MVVKRCLPCPCGETIVGESEDDLVDKAKEHLAAVHPAIASRYDREDILLMAY
ncbi:MAG: hypothetical protein QOI47_888 [Actinomycetota bacterium]|jgi:hypothetical protein|nr:hypothetical protein [Actinomycetota bacterium]